MGNICKKHNVEKQEFCVNIYTDKVKKLCPVCNQERNRRFEVKMRIDELKDMIQQHKKQIEDCRNRINGYRAAKSASN